MISENNNRNIYEIKTPTNILENLTYSEACELKRCAQTHSFALPELTLHARALSCFRAHASAR